MTTTTLHTSGKNLNAMRLAPVYGQDTYGAIGASAFRSLQASFLLQATGHSHYATGPKTRLRRHVFVEGPRGQLKSSMVERFLVDGCGGVEINAASHPGFLRTVPTYKILDGGTTFEALRGGYKEDGDVIEPKFLGADILFASEFEAFIGGAPNCFQILRKLNIALEEGYMCVDQLRGAAEPELARELEERYANHPDIHYSARTKSFTFNVRQTMWACSTPFEPKVQAFADTSGSMSRFDLIQASASATAYKGQVRNILRNIGGGVDLSPLRRINTAAWNTPVHKVPYPDQEIVDIVGEHVIGSIEDIVKNTGYVFDEVFNWRIVNDFMQVVTANAFARILAGRDPDDRSPIEVLEYAQTDATAARSSFDSTIGVLAERLATNDKDTGHVPATVKRFEELVREQGATHGGDPTAIARKDFYAFYKKRGLSPNTANNDLSTLRGNRLITAGHGADHLFVDSDYLRTLGFLNGGDA